MNTITAVLINKFEYYLLCLFINLTSPVEIDDYYSFPLFFYFRLCNFYVLIKENMLSTKYILICPASSPSYMPALE